jgi:hypothetical protein
MEDQAMKKIKKNKIQSLLVNHLLQEGSIELILPDGMILEVGLTQEGETGNLEITPDYCWVIASQHDRTVSIDSYNLGLRYSQDEDKLIYEQDSIDYMGGTVRIVNVS